MTKTARARLAAWNAYIDGDTHRDELAAWFQAHAALIEKSGEFLGFDRPMDVTVHGFSGYRVLDIGLVGVDYSDLEFTLSEAAEVAAWALEGLADGLR